MKLTMAMAAGGGEDGNRRWQPEVAPVELYFTCRAHRRWQLEVEKMTEGKLVWQRRARLALGSLRIARNRTRELGDSLWDLEFSLGSSEMWVW